MKTCERLVSKGRFLPTNPADLLAKSYHELLESKQSILGNLFHLKMLINYLMDKLVIVV